MAKAASLNVTMNQIQKHRIHPAADFLPLLQGFVQYMCAGVWVNVQRDMYVCMQITCSISFVFVHFIQCRGNVLHRNWFYSASLILQSPISPSLLLEPILFGANCMFTLKIASKTCTRTVGSKEQSDKYKVAFLCFLPRYW